MQKCKISEKKIRYVEYLHEFFHAREQVWKILVHGNLVITDWKTPQSHYSTAVTQQVTGLFHGAVSQLGYTRRQRGSHQGCVFLVYFAHENSWSTQVFTSTWRYLLWKQRDPSSQTPGQMMFLWTWYSDERNVSLSLKITVRCSQNSLFPCKIKITAKLIFTVHVPLNYDSIEMRVRQPQATSQKSRCPKGKWIFAFSARKTE